MAAIYAFLPVTKVYFTSHPYPLYNSDDVEEEMDITSAYMVAWLPHNFQETVSVNWASVSTVIAYVYMDQGLENIQESVEVLDVNIITVADYVAIDQGLENFDETLEVSSVTIANVINYIYIDQPPDNVEEEFDVTSVVLQAPP